MTYGSILMGLGNTVQEDWVSLRLTSRNSVSR